MAKGNPVPEHLRVTKGFHGTKRDISDAIVPSNQHGQTPAWSVSDTDSTYFMPSPDEQQVKDAGWNWNHRDVDTSAEVNAWRWSEHKGSSLQGRPRVYVTSPNAEQHFDGNIDENPRDALTAARVTPSQTITDTIWGPPPRAGGHTEMTLPHINWRQFGAPNYTVHVPSMNAVYDDLGNRQ